ncbi:MAG: alpha/beta hydrolase [Syntrophales bacterium LBB04]|nr:alpha/beta hydrolase [Syntrophales bacterium LBB04]
MNTKLLKKILIGDFTFKRLIKSVLFIYFFFFFFGLIFPENLIFRPPHPSYLKLNDGFILKTADKNNLYCIYLKNPDSKYTIVYFHGNAEDLGQILPFLEEYRDRGFSIFSYDYRSYGQSTGKPEEKKLYQDLNLIYNYLTGTLNIPASNIIIHGRSVGGGLATELASKKSCTGLILESSFVSAFRVLTRIPIFPFDMYKNIDKIKNIKAPILVIHGMNDHVISFWHGNKLFEKANAPKTSFWVEGAGHNDLLDIAGVNYWIIIKNFIICLIT